MKKNFKTTCPYCGVGCGVIAEVNDNGAVNVRGDKAHPANLGKLCSKGMALGDTLALDDRLLKPVVNGCEADWETAIDAVASGLKTVRDEYGPDAIGFYVSGQLLTEDYYVANKLMKGFIGSANIDTNSRLCMSSSVAGHKRAFGSDTVPGNYEDWEQADLVVLVGSNAAWCHPILYQRLLKARKKRGTKIVVIDPRRTATCDQADLHLPIRPGMDVKLFNGLLAYLADRGLEDTDFTRHHTNGLKEAVDSALQDASDQMETARQCDLDLPDMLQFYELFAGTEKVLTVYSQGVNQSRQGTDKVNAIINCHLFTGRIGMPGMGPFSVTGQPNAMGGREVGGLANMLAAHMDFDESSRDRVGRFWGSDVIAGKPGLKAVDMFRAVHEGKIKALWIMATNPVVTLPDADYVRAALEKCELVIVSEMMANTDTMTYADIALPALGWGEKGGTVTNSERRISRQRQFLAAPGEAKADWWIMSEVAKKMGFNRAFSYQNQHEIFLEHTALSAFENEGGRDFDLSGLTELDRTAYDNLSPVQWPVTSNDKAGRARFFADGRFYTANGRANFIAVTNRAPANLPDDNYPLILNTGRLRDQWHTMTRTGKAPRLNGHREEPMLAVHPDDAEKYGLEDLGFVRLKSRWSDALARVEITGDQQPGQVFLPMHWNDAYASNAVVGRLVNPVTDPVSGQPESKHTPVKIEKWQPDWHAFLLSREKQRPEDVDYWAYSYQDNCHILELAGSGGTDQCAFLAPWLCQRGQDNVLSFTQETKGEIRLARINNGRLDFCLMVTCKGALPSRQWLQGLFSEEQLDDDTLSSLLSGRPPGLVGDLGPLVCSCFGVHRGDILEAVKNGADTVDEVGACLQAGTNCGSCRPEIGKLLSG
ncbi:molybdopterin-dependent oxidoreductase [Emcibacter sp.]|uniref:molybdopterin-dependent oxidoreductase n=1 Tax=Emcibacter sp. TaxID=1979954 RepID=UPI003A929071